MELGPLTFLNPAGLWALAGIPAILAIHFLQRQRRRVPVSTLFLIEQMAAQSLSGSRWERLRNSVPLWLQLLSVLLLTWLLTQPHLKKEEEVQRVVVILDTSWSMSAFAGRVRDELPVELEKIARAASRTDWILMESDRSRGNLYRGPSLRALLNAMEAWDPNMPQHDFSTAWRVGSALLQGEGTLFFVTDHPVKTPPGVKVVSYGKSTDNAGFAGLRTVRDPDSGELRWEALVRNYGETTVETSWRLEAGGKVSDAEAVSLPPEETRLLSGIFPDGVKQLELILKDDAFLADNRLPIRRPEPKTLFVEIAAGPHMDFWKKLTAATAHLEAAEGETEADLTLGYYDPLNPASIDEMAGIYFVRDLNPPREARGELIMPELHPFTDGLVWEGLAVGKSLRASAREEDEVLVWQGESPLIILRPLALGQNQLILNFDLRYSNADKHVAPLILINRYLESVRENKIMFAAGNADCNQVLRIATDPEVRQELFVRSTAGPATPEVFREYHARQMSVLRAPGQPGFFEVMQGDQTLFEGAAQFADSREADLKNAGPIPETADTDFDALRLALTRQDDFLSPVWIILLGVIILGTWWISARRGE